MEADAVLCTNGRGWPTQTAALNVVSLNSCQWPAFVLGGSFIPQSIYILHKRSGHNVIHNCNIHKLLLGLNNWVCAGYVSRFCPYMEEMVALFPCGVGVSRHVLVQLVCWFSGVAVWLSGYSVWLWEHCGLQCMLECFHCVHVQGYTCTGSACYTTVNIICSVLVGRV